MSTPWRLLWSSAADNLAVNGKARYHRNSLTKQGSRIDKRVNLTMRLKRRACEVGTERSFVVKKGKKTWKKGTIIEIHGKLAAKRLKDLRVDPYLSQKRTKQIKTDAPWQKAGGCKNNMIEYARSWPLTFDSTSCHIKCLDTK